MGVFDLLGERVDSLMGTLADWNRRLSESELQNPFDAEIVLDFSLLVSELLVLHFQSLDVLAELPHQMLLFLVDWIFKFSQSTELHFFVLDVILHLDMDQLQSLLLFQQVVEKPLQAFLVDSLHRRGQFGQLFFQSLDLSLRLL